MRKSLKTNVYEEHLKDLCISINTEKLADMITVMSHGGGGWVAI